MEVTSGGTGWVTGTDDAVIRIDDDDRWGVTVEASPAAIVEGETREVRLTARIMHVDTGGVASVPPADTCVARFHVEVGLEVGGTATGAGTDYTLEGSTPEREIAPCAAAAEWRVTLSALVDTVDDDAETVTFTPVPGGAEPFVPAALEAATVTIGEEPGVVLGLATLAVEEGESASYTVILTSRPSGTVTITPSVTGDMDVTVSPSSIRFDGNNWALPQSVTVRAAHDEDDEDDAATVSHGVSGADYGSVTVGQVRVNVRDDDKSFGELRVTLAGGRDGGRSSPVPTIHHGEKFRIGLHWSETRTWPWAEPHRAVGADRAIRVTGGTVKPVVTPHYNKFTQHVLILEFTPDSAGSDVTLVLEPLDCSSPDPQRPNPHALCARLDNGNGAITGLAERVRYTVYGIDSAPAAPSNLLIEAEDQLASDGVTVTVTGTVLFAVFDPPAPGAERWRVEAQAPGGDWSDPRVWRGDRRGTRYPYRARMNGLAADGAWEIRARWENRYGAGPWAEAETTDAPALAAPRNVQVAQGAQGRSASLTWSPPAGSSGQVARYQYRLGWDAASWAEGWRAIPDSGPGAANERSYTVDGVEQSWSVEASIRAVDRSGRAGTPSAVARVPAAAPTVLEGGVRVTSDPGRDGRYAIGDAIDVAVRMSRPVVLAGAGTGFNFNRQRGEWIREAGASSESGPTVTLEIGDRQPAAQLVRIGGVAGADIPGSVSGDTLHFRYTVQGIDEDMDGIRIPSGGLSLNSSELVDANDADTAARFSLNEAIAFPGHLVQGVPAQVEKIERVGHQVWVYFTQDLTPVTLVPHLRNGAIGDQFRVEFPSAGSGGGDVTDARIVRGRGWGSNCRRGETGCLAVRLTTRSRARADETMTVAYVPNPHHPKYRLRDLAGNEAKAFGRTTAVPLGQGDSPVMSVSDAKAFEQIPYLRTAHFNVKLTPAADREVTVRYTTQDGRVDGDQLGPRGYLSATEGVDYEKESGTLVFRPGDTVHPVRVQIIDDGVEDGGEVFALVLSDLTGPATFADSVGQGIIHNHEVLTAAFGEVPEDHDGASAFSLELAFNEPVTADADTVKGALTVTGGEATTVTAVGTDAKRFELTVTPSGTDAVTVAIGPELDCTATNAVCTAEDIGLERRFETTIDHDGSAALKAPTVAGVAQVGATLEASFEETPSGTLARQWLRGEEEIAGAQGATYAPVAADVGARLAVRVSRGEETATSEPTAPVWAVPANPPLATGEEELLSATLTLGASAEFPLRMGGYNRFVGGPFGEMDETSFDEGVRTHVVQMVMLNELGRFVLATQGRAAPGRRARRCTGTQHRIDGLEPKQCGTGARHARRAERDPPRDLPPARGRDRRGREGRGIGPAHARRGERHRRIGHLGAGRQRHLGRGRDGGGRAHVQRAGHGFGRSADARRDARRQPARGDVRRGLGHGHPHLHVDGDRSGCGCETRPGGIERTRAERRDADRRGERGRRHRVQGGALGDGGRDRARRLGRPGVDGGRDHRGADDVQRAGDGRGHESVDRDPDRRFRPSRPARLRLGLGDGHRRLRDRGAGRRLHRALGGRRQPGGERGGRGLGGLGPRGGPPPRRDGADGGARRGRGAADGGVRGGAGGPRRPALHAPPAFRRGDFVRRRAAGCRGLRGDGRDDGRRGTGNTRRRPRLEPGRDARRRLGRRDGDAADTGLRAGERGLHR